MTVDRSYLPFKSAREYRDRKMAKWMGFFLSEHSTALHETGHTIDFSATLSLSEKVLLLNQAYSNGLTLNFIVIKKNKRELVSGYITQLAPEQIGIQSPNRHYMLNIDDIVAIDVATITET